MNQSASPSTPAVTIVHPALRWTSSILWIILGVVVVLLVALAFASWFADGGIFTGCVTALTAGASLFLIRRLPVKNFTQLTVSYGLLACTLLYLTHDDAAVRQPARIGAALPSFPGAAESYDVLMRYGKQQPLAREFKLPTSPALRPGAGSWKPAEPGWQAWLSANGAEIESSWAKLEPVRSWWTELNVFERVGDLTPPRSDADILAFQPVRAVFQHACAIASLHALDGNETAAIETLVPILELSRKLQPYSRTLIRSMIGIAGEKLALETATFILDTTTVSAEGRARLAAALGGGATADEGARRLVTIEYEQAEVLLRDPATGVFPVIPSLPRWTHRGVSHLARIIYNPQRTLNLYCDMTIEMQRRATNPTGGDIDAVVVESLQAPRYSFKNFAGPAVLRMITPQYNNILKTYWKSEDLRTALEQRLQA